MRLAYLLLVLALGCAPRQQKPPSQLPAPHEVVEKALRKLSGEGAFRFDWSFSRLKGQVKGEFSGLAEDGDVHLKGDWVFGKERERVEVVGIGDREYRLEQGKWVEAPRGEETSPLAQLERILALGKFSLEGSQKGCLVYSFAPNVALLDPLLEVKAQGEIWIGEKSSLPEKVLVADEGETLYWRFSLYDFGTTSKVISPVRRQHEFILEGKDLARVLPLVRRRLDILGFSACGIEIVKEGRMRVCISASRDPSDEIAQVLERGVVEVFSAVYPEEPVYRLREGFLQEEYGEEAILGFEKGDPTRPLVLLTAILSSDDLDGAEVSYDHLSRPWVDIAVKEDAGKKAVRHVRESGRQVLAVMVDGEVVAAPKLQEETTSLSSLRVDGQLSAREAEILRAKIDSGPLPGELRILKPEVTE